MKLILKTIAFISLVTTVVSCAKSENKPPENSTWEVTTLAGSVKGRKDGLGTNAQFDGPTAICVDMQGNIYVADMYNHLIRKITPAGQVNTLAGSSIGYLDGNGAFSKFNQPGGICVDQHGNVFVADIYNHKIRKITPSGDVTTVAGSTPGYADGKGSAAKFYYPVGICIDSDGILYVADQINNKIRKITQDGTVSLYAGGPGGNANGPSTTAGFNNPTGICINAEKTVFVVDYSGHRIRKISKDLMVTTLAGNTEGFADSIGSAALFDHPFGLCLDKEGNVIVADMGNQKIRKVAVDGTVTTIAGIDPGYIDGAIDSAKFQSPTGICMDKQGNFYIAEVGGHHIRKLSKP